MREAAHALDADRWGIYGLITSWILLEFLASSGSLAKTKDGESPPKLF